MGIDHNKRLKEHLYYYSARISRDISNLIKWLVLAVITGCIVGADSTLFSFTLKVAMILSHENTDKDLSRI